MMRQLLLLTILFPFISTSLLSGAPLRGNQSYQDQLGAGLQEVRGTLDNVRYELKNHELEIRVFEEKLQSLDSIIDNLRDQFSDASKKNKESFKSDCTSLESKISALDVMSKNLITDIKQFKTHSTEVSEILMQYKQKMGEFEKIIAQQGQSIDHLQIAMRALTEVLQEGGPSGKGNGSGIPYRVQSGDNLEKIARINQISVQTIKERNSLTNDRIFVGQLLYLPEK